MAHYYEINDTLTGDILDVLTFCSDYCHYWYCHQNGLEYGGWNGCHEHPYDDECLECGTLIKGVEQAVAC